MKSKLIVGCVVRAILVEDSITCAAVALHALRYCGFAVERYGSAKGARCALNGRQFDLAIVDANIPEFDSSDVAHTAGIDVANAIKCSSPTCKIIIWSGDPGIGQVASDLGFAFVFKNDPVKLLAAIQCNLR